MGPEVIYHEAFGRSGEMLISLCNNTRVLDNPFKTELFIKEHAHYRTSAPTGVRCVG